MPGLVGIASSHRPCSGSLADRMGAPLLHRDWYQTTSRYSDHFAVASISLSNEDHIADDGRYILAYAGRFPDLLPAADAISPAEFLLRRFQEGGVDRLCGLNGFYVIVVWDRTERRLTVVNDRYGFKQFFYWHDGDRLLFASEAKALLEDDSFRPELNREALGPYLQLTFTVDDETLFEGVHSLAPATVIEFHEGNLSRSSSYWVPPIDRNAFADRSRTDLVAEMSDRLETAVRRGKSDHNFVFLTGGLDSRTVAAYLARHNEEHTVTSCSMGYPRSYDVRFGAQLANALDFRHIHLNVPESYIADYSEEGIWRLEGGLSAHGFWSFEADSVLEEGRPYTVFHGLLGDAMAGERALAEKPVVDTLSLDEGFDYIYDKYYATTFGDGELRTLLKPEVHEAALGRARRKLRATFDEAPGDQFFDKLEYTELRQRQRQFTRMQLEIYAALAEVSAPFADNDYVDFMCQLPQKARIDKNLYKEMIVRRLPEVSQVPYARTGLPIVNAPVRSLITRVKNRFKYHVAPAVTFGNYKPVHFGVWVRYDDWLRTGSRDFVEKHLRSNPYLEDLFEMDKVRQLVDDHMNGRADIYGKLCILLTFALWRGRFVDNPVRTRT